MKLIFFVLLLGLSGCGNKLVEDHAMGDFQANYASVEMYLGEEHKQGLGVIAVKKGSPLDSVPISVQGYSEGSVSFFHSSCAPDYLANESLRYKNSEKVKIPWDARGTFQEDCTIGITLSPEYPPETKQDIVLSSFKGFVRIRVLDDPESIWKGYVSRVRQGGDSLIKIQKNLPLSQTEKVSFRGCGIRYDGEFPVGSDLSVWFSLKALGMDLSRVQTCVVEGYLHDEDLLITWLVNVYNKDYTLLPRPAITLGSDYASVKADPQVSILALDQGLYFGNDTWFNLDKSKPHTLRVLTVRRILFADFNPQSGRFTWGDHL